ncbi:septum formation initiator [Cutibacterium acnes HL042PA3]|nr:septum formation initiator [Cutibacterium acnes HL042PA3]MCW5113214.1 septum formation initiator [Cutibacterium acnes P05]
MSSPNRSGPRNRGNYQRTTRTEPPRNRATQEEGGQPRRFGLTLRAVVMGAAVLLVLVMITPSLGIYFSQRSQISRTQDDEARTRASISTLQDEVKRWHDPDYVRAQARSQLGWVMPGETGYQVIGENGKVIGSTTSLDEKDPASEASADARWWREAAGSVQDADHPAPPRPTPGAMITPTPSAKLSSPSPSCR